MLLIHWKQACVLEMAYYFVLLLAVVVVVFSSWPSDSLHATSDACKSSFAFCHKLQLFFEAAFHFSSHHFKKVTEVVNLG